MTRLAISYPIPVPGAATQSTATADRYVCSLVAAAAAWCSGKALGGAARGQTDLAAMFETAFEAEDVPAGRASNWAHAVMGGYLACDLMPPGVDGMTLSGYQRDALADLLNAGGVLGLACGLGKTVAAVAGAATAYFSRNASDARCWIVCPLNAMGAWKRYVPWLKGMFHDVQILSMDSIFKIADGLDDRGGVIIFDEAHMLGGAQARRTKAAHKLRLKFDFGLCLTGTLLHGGIEKTLSIQDLAVPGLALFSSRWKCGEHFKCLVKKRIGARTVTAIEKPSGKNRAAFLEYLSRGVISLTKHSPAVRCAVSIPEQELTTVEIGDCNAPLENLAVEYIQAKLAACPGEIPTAQEVAHALCRTGGEAKLDWLLDQLDAPCVVFAHYTDTLDLAERTLVEAGISLARIDGTTSVKDRDEAERKFQAGEVQVLLGQITAAGVSKEFFASNVSVTLDVNWKADTYSQALARTCRRGQTHKCHHFDLVANKLQREIVNRLRDAQDFDASLESWQRIKQLTKETPP